MAASLVSPTLGDVYLYGIYSNRTAMASALGVLAASGRLRATHLLDAAFLKSATSATGGGDSSLDVAYAAAARGRTAHIFRHVALCQARCRTIAVSSNPRRLRCDPPASSLAPQALVEHTSYFAGGHVYSMVMRLRPDVLFTSGAPVRLDLYTDPSVLYIPPPHNAWKRPGDEVKACYVCDWNGYVCEWRAAAGVAAF